MNKKYFLFYTYKKKRPSLDGLFFLPSCCGMSCVERSEKAAPSKARRPLGVRAQPQQEPCVLNVK